ncbi:MAG: sigma-70 region 4 domain-containing protein [Tannerellaceae bacterium]|nr:sigma-70 region 4 domain-containing protein [Tannerellaceae bacterium]
MIDAEHNRTQTELIQKILSHLTPRQKEIIYYKFIQELEYDQICELMDLNYQSARNLLQRSLKKIKEHITPEDMESLILYFLLFAYRY